MTKIKITKRVVVEGVVDIEFPLYYYWGDASDYAAHSWDTYGRLLADGSMTEVKYEEDGQTGREWSISIKVIDIKKELGEYVGYTAITADKWHDKFSEAMVFFSAIEV